MYWFYSYTWESKGGGVNHSMDVFKGSFTKLILHTATQPESWCIIFVREITEQEYAALEGEIG